MICFKLSLSLLEDCCCTLSARLLLPFDKHFKIKAALNGKFEKCLHCSQRIKTLPLVIDGPSRINLVIPNNRFERVAFPKVKRIDRLDVVMMINQKRRPVFFRLYMSAEYN